MPSDDDSSDLSSLSSLSPVPSDIELEQGSDNEEQPSKTGILKFFSKVSDQEPRSPSPPPRKRSPSPTHEYVLADNPDIAFIVMFRSRFTDAFPKSMANFGPQELERDVVESIPGDRVEHFLCALLGLLLNRKQDVKLGHYGRALEDAITTHKSQWPASWEEKSPIAGDASFNTMSPTERLTLLRVLILWCMSSSDSVKALINQSYKQNRHEDDLNQPRSVQPWGSDADKRRYFLVEGQDDTAFRVYRESNPAGTNRTWWSVASTIEELQALADKLQNKYGGPKSKALSFKMLQAIPRFEAGEEKRRKREYRQMRKEQFKRPEPGFSMYEGRTRGKRVKYTYSDDEDIFFSDSTGQRRSARNTGASTPADYGPVTTASGRAIRAPPRLVDDSAGGSVQGDTSDFDGEASVRASGRPRRSAAVNHGTNGWSDSGSRLRRGHSMDTEESESEGEFGDDEEEDEPEVQVAEESEDDDFPEGLEEEELDDEPRSLVVKLEVTPPNLRTVLTPIEQTPNVLPAEPDVKDEQMKTDQSSMQDDGPSAMPPEPAADKSIKQISIQQQPATSGPAPEAEPEPMDISPAPQSKFQPSLDMIMTKDEDPIPKQTSPPQQLEKPMMPQTQPTSLAFRGSPEKPHPQQLPPPSSFTTQEQ